MIEKKRTKKQKQSISAQEFFASQSFKPEGLKHLIVCKCFLTQFKNMENPPLHKFIVFSELDENANLKPSYAQCNNCGIVHKIIEVNESIILKKEDTKSVETIDEISNEIPERIKGILQKYDVELPTWQETRFIINNKLWGRFVVLSKERNENNVFGKMLVILGDNLYKIETFEREE